jgi:hypothetical protein
MKREGVQKQIKEMVFDFMEDLDELILTTHPVRSGLRGWIEENGYRNPGFASTRRDHPNGYPPNSLDCMLQDAAAFGRLKVLFSGAWPKSIPEAIRVATAIVKELSGPQAWLEHLDDIHHEILM